MPFTPRMISDNFEKLPFSDDEKSLLRRCLETPWDDAPLLVYADWVEEHGEEERADFIRKQVLPNDPLDWDDVPKVVWEWGKKIFPTAKERGEFYRGFPSHREFSFGQMTPAKFLKKLSSHDWDWIFSVDYEYSYPVVNETFFTNPCLLQITSLRITGDGYPIGDEETTGAIQDPMLSFLASPYLTNLTRLAINFPESQENLAQLAQSDKLTNLTSIVFEENWFNKTEMKAFVENSKLTSLSDLSIPRIDLDALRELASSNLANQLTSLRLANARVTAKGAGVIAESKNFQNLRKLDVSGGSVGNAGAKRLASSNFLRELRWLSLRDERVNRAGVIAIGNSPIFSNLNYLNLSSNILESDGVVALAKSKYLENLKELNLNHCYITNKGILALVNSEFIERLEVLRIGGNYFDSEAINAIASSPHLRTLKELRFELKTLSEADRDMLFHSPNLQQCRLINDSD